MLRRNVIVSFALVLCLSIVLTACTQNVVKETGGAVVEEKQEKITFRIGHEMPETHPYHLGIVKFMEILNEKSGGRFEANYYPNGQLGKQKELAEMVASDQLDICLVWQGIVEGFDPEVGVVSLPYLFRDWEHTWKVMDGPIGQKIMGGAEKKGIKVLTNFNNGLYSIVSVMQIKTPEDLKGVKMRVQPSAVFTKIYEGFGAVVTPLAFGEVYTALQLGTMDAQIQGPINVYESKHYEVAKYTCENNIHYLLEPVLFSKKAFDRLSKEDQDLVEEAAKEAATWQRENAEQAHEENKKRLTEQGMEYFPADIELWETEAKKVYEKFPEWEGIIEEIRAVK